MTTWQSHRDLQHLNSLMRHCEARSAVAIPSRLPIPSPLMRHCEARSAVAIPKEHRHLPPLCVIARHIVPWQSRRSTDTFPPYASLRGAQATWQSRRGFRYLPPYASLRSTQCRGNPVETSNTFTPSYASLRGTQCRGNPEGAPIPSPPYASLRSTQCRGNPVEANTWSLVLPSYTPPRQRGNLPLRRKLFKKVFLNPFSWKFSLVTFFFKRK